MRKLSINLPPFAPDYSGVCSALFALGGLLVIHDASGCTGNYTGYDEPRWYDSRSLVYCSGLREMDAVLGNDEKFIARIRQAAAELSPEFICFMGSPAPMVIGTDLKGIAAELEEITGIPALGFETTGLNYYDKGISDAYLAFADKFFPARAGQTRPGSINILGLTPLDFSHNSNAGDFIREMEKQGFSVIADFSMESDFGQILQAPSARINVVAAKSGLALAQWMEKRYGIPYVVGVPTGTAAAELLAVLIRETMADGKSRSLEVPEMLPEPSPQEAKGILLIGEEVAIRSIAADLYRQKGLSGIQLATLFGPIKKLYRQECLAFNSEREIRLAVNCGNYHTIIADPLIKQLIRTDTDVQFIEFSHVAVSSKICWDHAPEIIGEKLNLL